MSKIGFIFVAATAIVVGTLINYSIAFSDGDGSSRGYGGGSYIGGGGGGHK